MVYVPRVLVTPLSPVATTVTSTPARVWPLPLWVTVPLIVPLVWARSGAAAKRSRAPTARAPRDARGRAAGSEGESRMGRALSGEAGSRFFSDRVERMWRRKVQLSGAQRKAPPAGTAGGHRWIGRKQRRNPGTLL